MKTKKIITSNNSTRKQWKPEQTMWRIVAVYFQKKKKGGKHYSGWAFADA